MQERVALRFTDVHIRDRVAAARQKSAVIGQPVDVINGRDHPELFFEWELFERLLRRAFSADPAARDIWRATFERELKIELPAGFWSVLESASAPYLAQMNRELELARSLDRADAVDRAAILQQIREVQAPFCVLRYNALKNARNIIGAQTISRVLYEAVAPFLQMTIITPEDPVRLQSIQEGCK